MKSKMIFLNDEFRSKLTSLVLPIAFQQFMLALVSASDAVMLGKINQNFMSAVSLAGQIQFVLNLFLAAMTIGTSILAAQYWGKGDKASIEKIFGMVMKVTVIVCGIFFLSAEFIPELLMKIFTSDDTLIQMGGEYLHVVGISYLLCGASQIYLCIMKNSDRAGRCTLISSFAVVLNIMLNVLFIFGLFGMPQMGIAGAALATVIARSGELLWAVMDSFKKNHICLKAKYFLYCPQEDLRKSFWKYTTPVLGNEIVWGLGFTMTSVIMGHLGTDAVAANSIAGIVKNLLLCFCIGIGSGGGIMVGNELGAGRLETAKIYGRKLCGLSIVSGMLTGLFILLITPIILHFSELTEQAYLYLKYMLMVSSYYVIGKSVNSTTIGGIFCAGGDSKFGLFCDTITLWCITVPLGLIAAFVLDLPVLTVYFIVNLDEMIKLPAVYYHYKKHQWIRDLTLKQVIE